MGAEDIPVKGWLLRIVILCNLWYGEMFVASPVCLRPILIYAGVRHILHDLQHNYRLIFWRADLCTDVRIAYILPVLAPNLTENEYSDEYQSLRLIYYWYGAAAQLTCLRHSFRMCSLWYCYGVGYGVGYAMKDDVRSNSILTLPCSRHTFLIF